MDFVDHSSRLIAGSAIAVAHALAIYGLLTLAPHTDTSIGARAVDVHFIAQDETPPTWRPPEARVVAPMVVTDEPQFPLVELSTAARSERAISVPQHIARNAPAEDRSVPKLVSAVEYVREPAPRYPPQSRRLREQGIVILRVVIDERGQACDIAVETSSGYARLDRAAREAVASAAFRPYLENGAPRRAQVLIPIEFFLNRSAA